MDKKIILSSLALDLKRVALGLHRKSFLMANRFLQEAISRKNEAKYLVKEPYINKILDKMEDDLRNSDVKKKSEDALMYSILIQNYVMHK